MYLVMRLIKSAKMQVAGVPVPQSIPLELAEGMIGAIPVFATEEEALADAGDKFQIMEIEVGVTNGSKHKEEIEG